jgi:hypothetical protein
MMTNRIGLLKPSGSPRRAICRMLLGLALLCVSIPAYAVPITISVDTTALAGTSAQLAFDFIDGDGPSNSVTVTGFSTDGVLGAASATGGVSGTLPGVVTLTDTDFFNELLTGLVLGTTLSFTFDTTANAGSSPDQFSVFLLDAGGSASLFPTIDPTGADALLAFDIDAAGTLALFNAVDGRVLVTQTGPSVPTTVPEPTTLMLVGAGAVMVASRLRRRS